MGVYLPFSLLWFVRLVRVLGPAFAGLGECVSTVLEELDFEGRTQQRWRSRGRVRAGGRRLHSRLKMGAEGEREEEDGSMAERKRKTATISKEIYGRIDLA
jgi:hypothetical protein